MTDSGHQWHVRHYEPGDEEGIRALYETVFNKPLTRAHWQWKLRALTSPTENEWVAQAADEIIGHYAVTPVRFKVDDREFVIPLGCDRMTHPQYRRRGIYSALGARANAMWKETGAPFQFAFIHGSLGSALRKLGWTRVVPLMRIKSVLRPTAMLARRFGVTAPRTPDAWVGKLYDALGHVASNTRVAHVDQAGNEFDALWRKLAPYYRYTAVRDRAWVQWRFLDTPEVEQTVLLARHGDEPCGYLAYRIRANPVKAWAEILDCFAAPGDHATIHALVQAARREFSMRALDAVTALVVRDSPLHDGFRRLGFWVAQRRYDFCIISYSSARISSEPSDWFVTGAEGDVA